jgi:hypothetical protein
MSSVDSQTCLMSGQSTNKKFEVPHQATANTAHLVISLMPSSTCGPHDIKQSTKDD